MNNIINFADHAKRLNPSNNLHSAAERKELVQSFFEIAGSEQYMASIFTNGSQYHITSSQSDVDPDLLKIEIFQLGADAPKRFYLDSKSSEILTDVIQPNDLGTNDPIIGDIIRENKEATYTINAISPPIDGIAEVVKTRIEHVLTDQTVPANLNDADTQLFISVLEEVNETFGRVDGINQDGETDLPLAA